MGTIMSCAPFVSSPHDVVRKMLEVSRASRDDVLCDLGCGDGRILATAVKDFGVKSAVGYEIREDLFRAATSEIEKSNLKERVHIYNRDLFQADLKEATLITLYLTTYANERLKPKLRAEARPGTRIVSHDFMINGWKPTRKENYNEHTIYVYTIPDSYSV
ncbi:MAG TPA: class I SAM-dependent methyltransferase [Candidatus Bathyarchaeia archaeon]|jgi:ribosomal protein L11 methylase PrmA|nr:class I SAM-dependent methyltransferase [Candidatus Bathyarchaeia archaeon]